MVCLVPLTDSEVDENLKSEWNVKIDPNELGKVQNSIRVMLAAFGKLLEKNTVEQLSQSIADNIIKACRCQ